MKQLEAELESSQRRILTLTDDLEEARAPFVADQGALKGAADAACGMCRFRTGDWKRHHYTWLTSTAGGGFAQQLKQLCLLLC